MMIKSIRNRILPALLLVSMICASATCYAKSGELSPVYGEELSDGSYSVEVESSSSMFRVVKAELTVTDGTMTAALTLSGTGYLKLFMGTGEEAAEAEEKDFVPYVEDEEGAYTYTIPVEALDKEFDCAAYSKKKEKWYDRKLMVLSSSLKDNVSSSKFADGKDTSEISGEEDTTEVSGETGTSDVEDGDYTIEVELSGGSGRADITSPAQVSVSDGKIVASIEWSSPDYDYMIVNGKKYFPVNTEGNSIFEIPVSGMDQEMEVIADTVAMSKPHEITYTLTFHSDTMQKKANDKVTTGIVIALTFLAVFVVIFLCVRIIRKKGKNE